MSKARSSHHQPLSAASLADAAFEVPPREDDAEAGVFGGLVADVGCGPDAVAVGTDEVGSGVGVLDVGVERVGLLDGWVVGSDVGLLVESSVKVGVLVGARLRVGEGDLVGSIDVVIEGRASGPLPPAPHADSRIRSGSATSSVALDRATARNMRKLLRVRSAHDGH
jgi:hypothetical protein